MASRSTEARGRPHAPDGVNRRLVFVIVSIGLCMAAIDQTIVATVLPRLQQDLHAQVNWSSWTITAYALGQVVVMPIAGKLSDQFGRKRTFLAAVALFTGASLCCGLASDMYVLVGLRAVQALGGGAFMPTATGIVADLYADDRDRAVGLFTSIFQLGGMIGPIFGGLIVEYWSWRGIFFLNVPIGVVLLLLGRRFIPKMTHLSRNPFDLWGVVLFGLSLLAGMLGVTYLGSGTHSASSVGFLVPVGLAVVGTIAFLRHAARSPAAFIPLRLLCGRGFGVMNLLNFLIGSAAIGFGVLVPLYAQHKLGISPLRSGTLLTARAVGGILLAVGSAAVLRRTGYRSPMVIGFLVLAAGLIVQQSTPYAISPYAWIALGAGMSGAGMGIAAPSSNVAMLQLAPRSTAAIAGLRGMFRQTGAIFAVSIATAVAARSGDPVTALGGAFLVLALMVICAIPLIWFVPEMDRRPGASSAPADLV